MTEGRRDDDPLMTTELHADRAERQSRILCAFPRAGKQYFYLRTCLSAAQLGWACTQTPQKSPIAAALALYSALLVGGVAGRGGCGRHRYSQNLAQTHAAKKTQPAAAFAFYPAPRVGGGTRTGWLRATPLEPKSSPKATPHHPSTKRGDEIQPTRRLRDFEQVLSSKNLHGLSAEAGC